MATHTRWILIALAILAPVAAKISRDFEDDAAGKVARGFTSEVGRWEVVQDGKNRVFAQLAKNDDDTFNVVLMDDSKFKDVDISVKLRAVAGKDDRGGGVVWRARDSKNYYIARYNPLEDNFRVYKVEGGKRTMFRDARVAGDEKWHTLRVTMKGAKIACYLDGTRHLEAEDSTFVDAGKVGLWSKSDAQTYFDDFGAEG